MISSQMFLAFVSIDAHQNEIPYNAVVISAIVVASKMATSIFVDSRMAASGNGSDFSITLRNSSDPPWCANTDRQGAVRGFVSDHRSWVLPLLQRRRWWFSLLRSSRTSIHAHTTCSCNSKRHRTNNHIYRSDQSNTAGRISWT